MSNWTRILQRGTLIVGAMIVGMAAQRLTDHSRYFEISKNIEIFANLYKEVNTYYVDELDPGKLMRIGIDAMLASLDPYTNYISESDIEGYRYITEGRYNGIGAQIKPVDNYPTILAPYKDSPAWKAGLRAGDQIIAIDGRSTEGRTEDEIGEFLKGYPGTTVELTVRRPGQSEPLTLTLVRDEVHIPNVPYYGMVSEDIGYVALTTFTRDAGRNVAQAVQKLREEHPEMKGLIFDLRGNGGGLLTEAVNVANVFIPKGELVVSTRGRVKEWDRSFKTLNNPVAPDLPLVVLVDRGTASASEIVSGTIQDLDRGVIIGQRTYGKGLVQNTRDVGYNARVKLTTAKYYIPSGRCIQAVRYENGEPAHIPDEERTPFKTRNGRTVLDGGGIKPDILIDPDEDSDILKTLVDKYFIFKYANEYCLEHDTIAPPEEFTFTEWDDFIAYLESHDFDFDTDSERLLEELKQKAEEEGYDVTAEVAAIEARIEQAKKDDLEKYREAIIDQIEKELASRFYFERGRIIVGLRNDPEIDTAIAVLHDGKRYKEILGIVE